MNEVMEHMPFPNTKWTKSEQESLKEGVDGELRHSLSTFVLTQSSFDQTDFGFILQFSADQISALKFDQLFSLYRKLYSTLEEKDQDTSLFEMDWNRVAAQHVKSLQDIENKKIKNQKY